MANNAKATGFETTLDTSRETIEAMLTQQEESQQATTEKAEEVAEEPTEEIAEELEEDQEALPEEGEDDSELEEELELESDQVEEDGQEIPTVYTINVNGEEQEVTLEELQSGYSRQSDYTRKTQELANQKKDSETELNAVREERAIYTQLLDQMRQQLSVGMQEEPDWVNLAENDPIGYNTQRAAWDESQKKQNAVLAEHQRMLQQSQQEQMQNLQAHVHNEGQLLQNAIPEWRNEKKATTEKAEIKQYAVNTLGFTEQEISQIFDHRAVLGIRKAMLYDKMQETTKKKPVVSTRAKVARPGASNVKVTQPKSKQARQKLAKSGSMHDAAKVFESML